jgi:hypothetical protein
MLVAGYIFVPCSWKYQITLYICAWFRSQKKNKTFRRCSVRIGLFFHPCEVQNRTMPFFVNKMQHIEIFKYNETPIEFEVINGEVFANATIMCKAFEKRPTKWLELESTKRYIEALKVKSSNSTSLIEVRKGNSTEFSQGTWIHEKLILKLATWLDVNFELWCDEKVTELLKNGKVELKPKTQIEILLESVQMLASIEQKQNDMDLRITAIEQTNQLALAELNHIERSTEEVPEIGIRLKINQIVRAYSEKTGIAYQDIWRSMYSKMLYAYRFNPNAYKKLHDKETKLDIIERENQLDNLFAIVSKELV